MMKSVVRGLFRLAFALSALIGAGATMIVTGYVTGIVTDDHIFQGLGFISETRMYILSSGGLVALLRTGVPLAIGMMRNRLAAFIQDVVTSPSGNG